MTTLNPLQDIVTESKDHDEKRKKAIQASPKLSNLSEPYITDNGRTWVYFRKDADVQKKAAEFEEARSVNHARSLFSK